MAGTVGNGSPQSCTQAALAQALQGGGLITFNSGGMAVTITLSAEYTIAADTEIDGAGLVTLDAQSLVRIFSVNVGVTLELNNLRLINGISIENGGAIKCNYLGRLILYRCQFEENRCTSEVEYGGGAIFAGSQSVVTISECNFLNNVSDGLGGAISLLISDAEILNCRFEGNSAADVGGAIYIDGAITNEGQLRISKTDFFTNQCGEKGGALFVQLYNANKLIIEECYLDFNRATGANGEALGGALFVVGGISTAPSYSGTLNVTSYTIEKSTFSENFALNQGGGIWQGNDVTGRLVNCTLTQNETEGLGGGIFRVSGTMSIIYSTIANNRAGFIGGGICGGNESDVMVTNSIIANNIALNPWNIKKNSADLLGDGGGNLEYPEKTADPNDTNCFIAATIADSLLLELADNGGFTPTLALRESSPAINNAISINDVIVDQRGFARTTSAEDSGAYQFNVTSVSTQVKYIGLVPGLSFIESGGIRLTPVKCAYQLTYTLPGLISDSSCFKIESQD